MRRVILILFTLLALPFVVEAQGVTYFKGTVYEALDQASKTGKLLLVEFYAPWNYKSRWMHDNTIAESDLSDNFVLVAVETVSVEGAKLAKSYEVTDYPNLLVFDRNGSVIDRIDKTMVVADFNARLAQARLSVDGYSALQLRQIFTAATNGNNDEMNKLVKDYFTSFGSQSIDVVALSDLFSSKNINYYGSVAFDYMIEHRKMFDSVFVEDRVRDLLIEAILPYISGIEVFDSIRIADIKTVAKDFSKLEIISQMSRLAYLRHTEDGVGFVQLLETTLTQIDAQYQYPLILSLDFIDPSTIDRNTKRMVSRILDGFASNGNSSAKNVVIQSLVDKFL